MMKRNIISKLSLLTIPLFSFSGCYCCDPLTYLTIAVDLFDENMIDELYHITYSNHEEIKRLSLETTYILDVYVDDDNFNSDPINVLTKYLKYQFL